MEEFPYTSVEEAIGYTFKNRALLKAAFTHRSYANEHGGECNERLEFLGDSVLQFIVTDSLVQNDKESEGVLTQKRAQIVSREPLSMAVDDMGLLRYYRMGVGASRDKKDGKEKFRSNLFEATLGAVYLDGGLESARTFVFSKLIDKAYSAPQNAKALLQEYLAKRGEAPKYDCTPDEGGFACVLTVLGETFLGHGDKKAIAEKSAAAAACKHLKIL